MSRLTPEMRAEVEELRQAIGIGRRDTRLAADRAKLSRWRWLESTKRLQEESYGYAFEPMRKNIRSLCDYLTHMSLAAFSELAEVLYEFEWKRWTTDKAWVDRDNVVDELIDVVHFVGNMAVALGVSDEEWQRRYMAKQDKNRRRMAEGYKQNPTHG
jgi:hypothetical protein